MLRASGGEGRTTHMLPLQEQLPAKGVLPEAGPPRGAAGAAALEHGRRTASGSREKRSSAIAARLLLHGRHRNNRRAHVVVLQRSHNAEEPLPDCVARVASRRAWLHGAQGPSPGPEATA